MLTQTKQLITNSTPAEHRLINLITSNPRACNYLNDLVMNAEEIDTDLGIILPGVDFTGLDQSQISSFLANFETIRIFLREAAKPSQV
jgi:hypothetical protein